MRAGKRPEDQDQHDQDRAGRYRVAQKRERDVPPASFWAMMPEPTTAASRNAVPSHSAKMRRASDGIRWPRPLIDDPLAVFLDEFAALGRQQFDHGFRRPA